MKICFVVPEYDPDIGGIATYYRGLIRALLENGHDVFAIAGSGFNFPRRWVSKGLSPDFASGEISVNESKYSLDHLEASPALRRLLRAAWSIWEEVDRAGPFDVVEVVDFSLLAIPHIIYPIAPTILRLHGGYGQLGSFEPHRGSELDRVLAFALETESLRHVDGRETPSASNAAYWSHQAGHSVLSVRPCWKPVSDVCVATPNSDVEPMIRIFGRVQSWKGPRVVAAAWAAARDLPDIDWYGRDVATDERGGSTDAELRRDYPDVWGVRIQPRSPVAPAEVARLQSSSLLNLVPSTWDVFNFTAIEALASGRPVLCSDKAGASELIEDGVTGFLYDGHNPQALADAVRRALALGPNRLAQIGACGRAHILGALQPETQVFHHLDGYEAAIRAHDPDHSAIPDWFKAIVLPRDPAKSIVSHLDQHPLRALSSHVLERTLRKLGLKA